MQVLQTGEASSDGCCGTSSSCCGTSNTSCCGTGNGDAVTSDLYSSAELGELPLAAALASLGLGDPTAPPGLKLSEEVVDLGSGGGSVAMLSARSLGAT